MADQWEANFSRLLDYVKHNGDARVSASCEIDGFKRGRWVIKQRYKRAEGMLDADRQRRLHQLPGWTWDTRTEQWEEGYRYLLDYVDSHGDARVPRSYKIGHYNVGRFVTHQRVKYAQGVLEIGYQHRLEELPGWTWNAVADQWEEGFGRLLDYVKRHGDARVPQPYKVDGYQLGTWVQRQRTVFTKGLLDHDRQRRLEELPGWKWDPHADRWEDAFVRLADYVKQHGHARVPSSEMVDGYQLGQWVKNQRAKHARGNLDADRQRRLERLPGWAWTLGVSKSK